MFLKKGKEMTKEEAKEIFLNRGFVNGVFDGDKWRQSIVMISDWLEEDHISDKHKTEIECNKIFKQMSYIINKYRNLGLKITIEVTGWGLILKGVWDLDNSDLYYFNHEYPWGFLLNLPEKSGVEHLIDEFKKEFEAEVKYYYSTWVKGRSKNV